MSEAKRAFSILDVSSLRASLSLNRAARASLLGLAASCCLSAQSVACSPSGEQTYIFSHAPTDVDASGIVEVTTEGRERGILHPKNPFPLKTGWKDTGEANLKGHVST